MRCTSNGAPHDTDIRNLSQALAVHDHRGDLRRRLPPSARLFTGAASAQMLGYAAPLQTSFPSDNMMAAPADSALSDEGGGNTYVLAERLRRAVVAIDTTEAPGTVIIDTGNTVLYYVLGPGRAMRYGVGVGRDGFTWSGVQAISRKAEWPDWHPPAQMIARQPYLPR